MFGGDEVLFHLRFAADEVLQGNTARKRTGGCEDFRFLAHPIRESIGQSKRGFLCHAGGAFDTAQGDQATRGCGKKHRIHGHSGEKLLGTLLVCRHEFLHSRCVPRDALNESRT